jgi:uncharacterized membrane protein YbaN (DUF454 family)
MKRYLLLTGGSVSLGLGVVGIFLPILPTTPLLLLAAYCFMRSSKKLHSWLINHPVLGLYIREYLEHRAISRPTKIWGITVLWLSLGVSIYLVPVQLLKPLLTIVGILVSIHILCLPTLTGDERYTEK